MGRQATIWPWLLATCARVCGFALCLSMAVGCAGQHFDGTVFRRGDVVFSVEGTPAGWRRIEVTGALLAYRDDRVEATIAVGGRCGKDGDDVPLEALTQHLFIHFTEREVVEQKRLSMDGREALRTQMLAKLDGVARGFVVYVLKKDGCVYDFLYIGRPESLVSDAEPFDRYVAGFRTEPR